MGLGRSLVVLTPLPGGYLLNFGDPPERGGNIPTGTTHWSSARLVVLVAEGAAVGR
jgi:hypothetical protein